MGRSSKKRSIGLWILGILAVAVIGVSVWQIAKLATAGSRETTPETSEPQSSESHPTEVTEGLDATEETPPAELALPLDLGNGVELESVFRYSGINPDYGEENGDEIGGIILNNKSGKFLSQLDLQITTSEGKTISFLVEDLPTGQTAWVFEKNNERFPSDAYPVAAQCDMAFLEEPAIPEGVTWSADGTEITLTNNSGKDLTDLTVVCRCQLEDVYFGGVAYTYTVESLPDGGSAVVSADDCYMGDAAVARIEAG